MSCNKYTSAVVGCWNNTSVVIHYTYGIDASGSQILEATRYTDSDGVVLTIPAIDTVIPGSCSSGSSSSCDDNDTTLASQSGTGNIPAGFKSVTINNLSGITTINGGFELGTGRRPNSISFGGDRGNCVNELLPAYTITGGTHQWIGHL